MNKKILKDKPAMKPSKQTCEACKDNALCPVVDNCANYKCPKMK